MARLLLAFFLALPALAQGGNGVDAVLNHLYATRVFNQVAISPDGNHVAYTQEIILAGRDTGATSLFIKDRRPGATAREVGLGAGDHAATGLAWSPDSRHLAFLASGSSAQRQLFTLDADSGTPRQLTSLAGYLADPAWSPDGSRLALLFAQNAGSGGGPLNPEPPATGVIGGAIHNQRLAVVAASGGAVSQLSPANLNVYEFDWSPDGREFAFSAAPGPADNNWWIAELYTLPLSGGTPRLLAHQPASQAQIAMPRWSPDGSTIAFIQGLMSDEGFTGGEIYTVPAAGGARVDRTPNRKSTPSGLFWAGPGQLLFTEYVGGGSALSRLDLATGHTTQLWQGNENLHLGGDGGNLALAHGGVVGAAIRGDWQHPPEIWAGALATWQPFTQDNAALRPDWGTAKSLTWTSDGFSVQGWLLYPENFDPSRRYPLVVSVHGGPANLSTPRWPTPNFDMSVLSGLGYFVFYPNPRGSYGQGLAFTKANVRDFGGGDLRDILAGLNAVETSAPVDPNRVGITGWSYGGYMTMWAVTQTQRFRAAVAGAGIADWLSYYGENSIDRWMIPYFGATVYDDGAVYAKSSPITYIRNVKTPTLVIVGERDGECPAPQSFEFWHALQTLGVPTQLVVYAGEGHRFHQTDNMRDRLQRTLAWFNQNLR